jgi:hypothetical protein
MLWASLERVMGAAEVGSPVDASLWRESTSITHAEKTGPLRREVSDRARLKRLHIELQIGRATRPTHYRGVTK